MVWNRFFRIYNKVDGVLDRNIGGTRLEVIKVCMVFAEGLNKQPR